MSEARSLVLYRVEGKVAVITLNRPDKMNALSRQLWKELDEAFARAEAEQEVQAIALVAEGRAFSAGADLSDGEDPTALLPWWEHFQRHQGRQFRMWDSSKVIIAGVNGHAIGRGLELALWCDIVVAAEDAKLGQPEVREGWVLHSMVPWLTTPQKAKLFMLSGDLIGAAEAERLGLVALVAPPGGATEAAIKLARKLSHLPPVTSRAVKQMVNGVYEQLGLRGQQAGGIATAALTSGMTPAERGIEELQRIRREQGFKASLKFRDAPFEE